MSTFRIDGPSLLIVIHWDTQRVVETVAPPCLQVLWGCSFTAERGQVELWDIEWVAERFSEP